MNSVLNFAYSCNDYSNTNSNTTLLVDSVFNFNTVAEEPKGFMYLTVFVFDVLLTL